MLLLLFFFFFFFFVLFLFLFCFYCLGFFSAKIGKEIRYLRFNSRSIFYLL